MPHQHLNSRQPSLQVEGLHHHLHQQQQQQEQLMSHSHRHNVSLPSSASYLDGASNSNGFGSMGSTPSASVASLASDAKQPLPSGWDVGQDFDGKVYFIDHVNKKTTWEDPRERYCWHAHNNNRKGSPTSVTSTHRNRCRCYLSVGLKFF